MVTPGDLCYHQVALKGVLRGWTITKIEACAIKRTHDRTWSSSSALPGCA